MTNQVTVLSSSVLSYEARQFILYVQDKYLDGVLSYLQFTEQSVYFLSATVTPHNNKTTSGNLLGPATRQNYDQVMSTWPAHVQKEVVSFFENDKPEYTRLIMQIETKLDGAFHLRTYTFKEGQKYEEPLPLPSVVAT